MKCRGLDFIELSCGILGAGNKLRFQACGGSMRPFIKDADILVVEPVDAGDVSVGDIVFFKTGNSRVAAHRVVKKEREADNTVLWVRADAYFGPAQNIFSDALLGKVISIERKGRPIKNLSGCQNSFLFFWVGIISCFYLFLWFLKKGGRFVVRSVLLSLQRLKYYRLLARKLTRGDIVFTKAELGDAYALARFYSDLESADPLALFSSFEEVLNADGNRGHFFIAKRKDDIIASLAIDPSCDDSFLNGAQDWFISGLTVSWFWRGAGIAGALVKEACAFAFARGALSVYLLVFADAKPALALYKKCGFSEALTPQIADKLKQDQQELGRRRIFLQKKNEDKF